MVNVDIHVPKQPTSISEAYKSLRTNLKFCGDDKKAIVITSCVENEGKSTIALQLAASLAEAGNSVCLVDADLRKSILMSAVQAERNPGGEYEETIPRNKNIAESEIPGFTHYLSGMATLNEVMSVTNVKNLCILFAGPTPPNPSEMLGSKKFAAAITNLRKAFDYLIIDTPPIGMVIDGAIVAENADGIILVMESGNDSYHLAQDIKEQLMKTGCPILGGVLNKVDTNKSNNGSYYGNYYGRYGGKKK